MYKQKNELNKIIKQNYNQLNWKMQWMLLFRKWKTLFVFLEAYQMILSKKFSRNLFLLLRLDSQLDSYPIITLTYSSIITTQ